MKILHLTYHHDGKRTIRGAVAICGFKYKRRKGVDKNLKTPVCQKCVRRIIGEDGLTHAC